MTGGGEEGGGIRGTFHPRQEIKKSTTSVAPSELQPRFQVIMDQMGEEDGSNRRCLIRGQDSRMGAAGIRGWEPLVGAKAKTPPFARCLRRTHCNNGDKTTGRLYPSSHASKDEGLWQSRLIPRPRPTWRPTCVPAHYSRPCVAAAHYEPNL